DPGNARRVPRLDVAHVSAVAALDIYNKDTRRHFARIVDKEVPAVPGPLQRQLVRANTSDRTDISPLDWNDRDPARGVGVRHEPAIGRDRQRRRIKASALSQHDLRAERARRLRPEPGDEQPHSSYGLARCDHGPIAVRQEARGDDLGERELAHPRYAGTSR